MRRRPELLKYTVVTVGRVSCVGLVAGAALVVARGSGSRHSTSWVWLVATLVVAGTVTATRAPLDRLADQVAYGRGGDPYAVLSDFVQRLSDTLALDDVLPNVARTVTQAMHSDRGEVRLWLTDGEQWRQTWPPNSHEARAEDVDIALSHHGEQVGELGLALAQADLSSDDRALLNRLAGTAGLALANVRLAYDLRRRLVESRLLASRLERSRQRLLDSAALQVRRFSALVDAQVQSRLDAAGAALDRVAAGDVDAVAEAKEEVTSALAALRELAAGVFPPALSDRGLANALSGYCMRFESGVALSTRTSETRAPLAIEAAAYFCAVQVVEGARKDVPVRLELQQNEEMVRLRVVAPGLDEETVELVRDRAEATGGLLELGTPPGPASASVEVLTLTWPSGTRLASSGLLASLEVSTR